MRSDAVTIASQRSAKQGATAGLNDESVARIQRVGITWRFPAINAP